MPRNTRNSRDQHTVYGCLPWATECPDASGVGGDVMIADNTGVCAPAHSTTYLHVGMYMYSPTISHTHLRLNNRFDTN